MKSPLLLLIALAVCFAGCDKPAEPPPPQAQAQKPAPPPEPPPAPPKPPEKPEPPPPPPPPPAVEKPAAPAPAVSIVGPRLTFQHKKVTYRIVVVNEGRLAAEDLELVHTLPRDMEYVSAEPGGYVNAPTADAPGSVVWKPSPLEAGSKIEYSVELKAAKIGTCTNSVRLTSKGGEPLSASAMTKVIGVPAMHISTYDTEDPCEVGVQTIYVIEMRNEGTSPCTNVQITSKITAELEFVEAESPVKHKREEGMVVFDPYPILQPGDKLTYRVRCKAVKSGPAKHTAILKFDQFEQPILDEEGTSVYK